LGKVFVLYCCVVLIGCEETTVHKTKLTREEAVASKLFSEPLPVSASNIYCYKQSGDVQGVTFFAKFDVAQEELHSAVEAIISHNNTAYRRNLPFERRELSMIPEGELTDSQASSKEAELDWWNPGSITKGYYRGQIESYAVRLWIDEGRRYFKLTEASFKELRNAGVPENVLDSLHPLQNQEFLLENELLEAVENHIGKEQTEKYKDLILKHADEGIRRIYLYPSD
jgi:hypothetical protein